MPAPVKRGESEKIMTIMTNNEIINEELLNILREYTHENEDGIEDPYQEYKETEAKCQDFLKENNINITINEEIPTITNYPIDLGLLDKLVITLSSGVTGCTPDVILYKYSNTVTSIEPDLITTTIRTTNIFGVYIYTEEILYDNFTEATNTKLINDFDYKFYTE